MPCAKWFKQQQGVHKVVEGGDSKQELSRASHDAAKVENLGQGDDIDAVGGHDTTTNKFGDNLDNTELVDL